MSNLQRAFIHEIGHVESANNRYSINIEKLLLSLNTFRFTRSFL